MAGADYGSQEADGSPECPGHSTLRSQCVWPSVMTTLQLHLWGQLRYILHGSPIVRTIDNKSDQAPSLTNSFSNQRQPISVAGAVFKPLTETKTPREHDLTATTASAVQQSYTTVVSVASLSRVAGITLSFSPAKPSKPNISFKGLQTFSSRPILHLPFPFFLLPTRNQAKRIFWSLFLQPYLQKSEGFRLPVIRSLRLG